MDRVWNVEHTPVQCKGCKNPFSSITLYSMVACRYSVVVNLYAPSITFNMVENHGFVEMKNKTNPMCFIPQKLITIRG